MRISPHVSRVRKNGEAGRPTARRFCRLGLFPQADLASLTKPVRRHVVRWFRMRRLLDADAAADMLTREKNRFSGTTRHRACGQAGRYRDGRLCGRQTSRQAPARHSPGLTRHSTSGTQSRKCRGPCDPPGRARCGRSLLGFEEVRQRGQRGGGVSGPSATGKGTSDRLQDEPGRGFPVPRDVAFVLAIVQHDVTMQ